MTLGRDTGTDLAGIVSAFESLGAAGKIRAWGLFCRIHFVIPHYGLQAKRFGSFPTVQVLSGVRGPDLTLSLGFEIHLTIERLCLLKARDSPPKKVIAVALKRRAMAMTIMVNKNAEVSSAVHRHHTVTASQSFIALHNQHRTAESG